jgi:hypothetical protein
MVGGIAMRLTVFFLAIVVGLCVAIPVPAQSKPQRLKVQCSRVEKYKVLLQSPDSAKIAGEVRCGKKVIVTGPVVWRGSFAYIPVKTADKITGYLPSDAFDKKKGASWKEVLADSIKQGTDAYARTADPHIAWCDNYGGFVDRAYENETVRVTLDNGQSGVGTIQHVYIVCKDGTRIKEM